MQKVCDVLEQVLSAGIVGKYAIGRATAAGFHGEPLAARDIDVFCFLKCSGGLVFSQLGTSSLRQQAPAARFPEIEKGNSGFTVQRIWN